MRISDWSSDVCSSDLLHLDAAVDVALCDSYPGELRRSATSSGQTRLVDGPHFDLWQLDGAPDASLTAELSGASLLIPPTGEYSILQLTVPGGACAARKSVW